MATVSVRPSGVQFEALDDMSVMASAQSQGFYWPTSCRGIGECRTCVMYVMDDLAAVSPPDPFEQEALASISFSMRGEPARWRLACQTHVVADVTVRKPGVARVE